MGISSAKETPLPVLPLTGFVPAKKGQWSHFVGFVVPIFVVLYPILSMQSSKLLQSLVSMSMEGSTDSYSAMSLQKLCYSWLLTLRSVSSATRLRPLLTEVSEALCIPSFPRFRRSITDPEQHRNHERETIERSETSRLTAQDPQHNGLSCSRSIPMALETHVESHNLRGFLPPLRTCHGHGHGNPDRADSS
jgi:hypothetical protein